MKTKMFNKRLFLDMFKQLAPMAVFFIGLMTFFSLQSFKNHLKAIGTESLETFKIFGVMLPADVPSIVFAVLGSVILTVVAFRFLNHRNSSDFYHSVPESRVSLFNSVYASIFAWIFIGLIIDLIVSLAFYYIAIPKANFVIHFPSITAALLALLSMSIVSSASFALAMSLSGKSVDNWLIGIMIMATPTIVRELIFSALDSRLPYLVSNFSNLVDDSILNRYNNLCTASLLEIVDGDDMFFFFETSEMAIAMGDYSNIISTLLIGIVIYIFAVYCFKSRDSERANSMNHGKIKNIAIAVWFSFVALFCGGYMQHVDIMFNNETRSTYAIVLPFLLAYFVYILYLMLSTRDYKYAFKMSYAFIAVLVLQGVVLGITGKVISNAQSFVPTVEEVKSVTISPTVSWYESDIFAAKKGSEVEITDEKVISLVTETLKQHVELLDEQSQNYWNYMHKDPEPDYHMYKIVFRTENGEKIRYLNFFNSEATELLNLLVENEEFVEAYTDLPDVDDKYFHIEQTSSMYLDMTYSDEYLNSEEIYEHMKIDIDGPYAKAYVKTLFNVSADMNSIAAVRFYMIENNTLNHREIYAYEDSFESTKEYLDSFVEEYRPLMVSKIETFLDSDKFSYAETHDDAQFSLYVNVNDMLNSFYLHCPVNLEGLKEIGKEEFVTILKDQMDNAILGSTEMHIEISMIYRSDIHEHEAYKYRFAIESIEDIPEEFMPYVQPVYDRYLKDNNLAQSAADTAA